MLNYEYIKDRDVFLVQYKNKEYYYNDYLNKISESNIIEGTNVKKNKKKRRRLVIMPSNACNLNCSYCFSEGDRTHNEILQIDDIKEYLDNMLDKDMEYPLHVVFTGGGEPTLNIEVMEYVVQKCNKLKDVTYHITTNGIFSENVRDFLIKNKFKLAISIDGSYHIESMQQLKYLSEDKYNIALNNAKNLKEQGLSVAISVVLEEKVFKEYYMNEKALVEETVSFLANHGFDIIGVVFDMNTFYSEVDDTIIDSMSRYCYALVDWKHKHKNVFINCPHIYRQQRKVSCNGICEAIQNYPYDIKIMPNGKVSFCNRVQVAELENNVEKFDTLREELMQNTLFLEALTKIRKKKQKCIKCISRQTCMSGICPASYLNNSDEKMDNYCRNNLNLRVSILEKFFSNID